MISFVDFNNIVSVFSVGGLRLNWIDLLIIMVIIIYIVQGYALGFIRSLLDLIGFAFSFLLALSFYNVISSPISEIFQIPKGISNVIGFFIIAFCLEISFVYLSKVLFRKWNFLKDIERKTSEQKNLNRILGVFPAVLSSLILLAFILTMIVALPLSTFLKNSLFEARFATAFVSKTQGFEENMNQVFGGALKDALTFLTVEPRGNSLLKLNFQTENIRIDENAEKKMLEMVNEEREKRGLPKLSQDVSLKETGRRHCTDMFTRGYFSHYTPEGLSPFDRMAQDNINYRYAGENLALAPNVVLAMQGLMRSPGHRENILSENFGRLGVGVIDGGVYGQMYCQEFTD